MERVRVDWEYHPVIWGGQERDGRWGSVQHALGMTRTVISCPLHWAAVHLCARWLCVYVS